MPGDALVFSSESHMGFGATILPSLTAVLAQCAIWTAFPTADYHGGSVATVADVLMSLRGAAAGASSKRFPGGPSSQRGALPGSRAPPECHEGV